MRRLATRDSRPISAVIIRKWDKFVDGLTTHAIIGVFFSFPHLHELFFHAKSETKLHQETNKTIYFWQDKISDEWVLNASKMFSSFWIAEKKDWKNN